MARVTDGEVREIMLEIDNQLSNLSAFITAANLVVTRHLGSNTDVSDAERKEIERWLSAHMVAIADPRLTEEEIDDASVKYHKAKMGLGLDATSYGQQVKVLDPTGILAGIGRGIAVMEVIPGAGSDD